MPVGAIIARGPCSTTYIPKGGWQLLEGEISQINLVERLVELWREQFTGAIRFENDGIIKIVYFKGGDILSASTNDRSDSIDEILMRAGKVSREHVKQALAKRKENETLGDALLNLGFITRKELTWARRVQAVGVIRSIAAWTDGSFTIVEDYLPKRDEGTLFSLPQVLVELIVTEQDRARFERALDGGQAVFAKKPDFQDVWRHLGLNEDAERIVDQIDGAKTAIEIATASESDSFNVYKLLHALSLLGVLSRTEKPQVTPQLTLDDDFAAAGVADAADLWGDPQPDLTGAAFELDDLTPPAPSAAPDFEVPAAAPELPQDALSEPAELKWEDEPEAFAEPVIMPDPETPGRLPAWEAPPREVLAVPIPAAIEPAAEAEEQWGFDEAQIETARRAAVPPEERPVEPVRKTSSGAFMQPRPRRRRSALPVVILLLIVVAAGGWYGFSWWESQQASGASAPLVERPSDSAAQTSAGASTTATTTIAESTTTAAPAVLTTSTTTTSATTATSASTGTSASQPASSTATPTATAEPLAPVVPQKSAEALAPVVPRSSEPGRERYDAMAQQFAANPEGNYTIQIQILCQASNLGQAMKAGGSQVWFVPQTISGRSCYRVFWGHFQTRDEAQRAMASVPASLRDRSAAVKAVPKQQ